MTSATVFNVVTPANDTPGSLQGRWTYADTRAFRTTAGATRSSMGCCMRFQAPASRAGAQW